MSLEFELAGSQIDGARDYQEDAFLITHLTDKNGNPSALVICADGMGGHAAGNVASNMAVQAFNKHVSSHYPAENLADVMREAIVQTNLSIKETITETPSLHGMGCTMIAAVLEEGKMTWASVGDSHLYLIRKKKLTKQNADHSYGGFLDRQKAAGNPIEPERGLARNMLMSAITGEEVNEVDVPDKAIALKEGDRLLICSDGMDTLEEEDIVKLASASQTPKDFTDGLMKAVERAKKPRQDNTTAVVVNVKKGSDNAAPAKKDAQGMQIEDEPSSKTGLVIGVAAAILIGAGAFFMLNEKPSEQLDLVEASDFDTDQESFSDESATQTEESDTEAEEATQEGTVQTTDEQTEKSASIAQAADGDSFRDPLSSGSEGPLMVWIPAGDFKMGSSSQREAGPKHDVSIEKFAVSVKEITIAEYNQYAAAAGIKKPKTQGLNPEIFPAFFMSWDEAYGYTKWLSKQTGKKYRLLSEAEWEYASSGGKKSPFWWGYEMESGKAHCFLGCNQEFNTNIPMKTGHFKANQFGLYDTLGNIAEWVHDCWHNNYKGAPTDGSVWEGGDCTQRVVRGGSFTSPEQSLTNYYRDKYKATSGYAFIGIRVARDE